MRLYTDASFLNGRAFIAVVQAEGSAVQLIALKEAEAASSNEAELLAFLEAVRLAPPKTAVYTDSAYVRAALLGTGSAHAHNLVQEILSLIESKRLFWDFIGGKRKRRRAHKKGSALADQAARTALLSPEKIAPPEEKE